MKGLGLDKMQGIQLYGIVSEGKGRTAFGLISLSAGPGRRALFYVLDSGRIDRHYWI